MSALAAVTSKIRLYASVAVLTIPPPIIARMAVTINDISDGRFGVNIVSGYNKKQYDQMGCWPGDEFFRPATTTPRSTCRSSRSSGRTARATSRASTCR